MTDSAKSPSVSDIEALLVLIKMWYGIRDWAIANLLYVLNVRDLRQLFGPELRGTHRLFPRSDAESLGPHELWYRAEDGVVDVFRPKNKGGIIFDVSGEGKPLPPDIPRLRQFLVKMLNAGALDKRVYRPLMQDRVRFSKAADEALNGSQGT